jgi:glycosyltransferase involved in cell wall biosynthesis
MRLLHIVPSYIPAYRYGGPIYSVHALCRSLAARGHEVHVLTTSVDGPDDSDVPYDRAVDLDGVQVHYNQSRWLRRLYWSPQLYAKCAEMVSGIEVVHLHSVFLFPTWAGARAAAGTGVPYVISPRGMLVRELIARRSPALKRAWIGLIERRNLRQAACIHLTSAEEERALADLELALAPTAVIPNGVDAPKAFSPSSVSNDVRATIAGGFDILSLGRISWKKGLERLIEALTRLPTARVVMAGQDDEGDAARLAGLAQDMGVSNRVRFLPRYIGEVDREALFAAARIFALPSLSENFGNVVVEAMVRGVPVVVTAEVGAAEIVAEKVAGVVTRGNPTDFATGLALLLDSEERRRAMGAAGAAYAREHLTWDGVAQRFGDLYGDVATARPGKIGDHRGPQLGHHRAPHPTRHHL